MSVTNQSSLGPGKAYRRGLSLMELHDLFPDDEAAEQWFVEARWPGGKIRCPRCNGRQVRRSTHQTMPYRCRRCRRFFSVRTGTLMERSHIGYQRWAFAIYLMVTNLKGTSSMHLHRDLGISQKSAWFMAHRIRKVWEDQQDGSNRYDGPVEFDEAFFGGREKNKHWDKRLRANWHRGKQIVAGARDHASGEISAKVVPDNTAQVLLEFVSVRVDPDAEVWTDDHGGYLGAQHRHIVRHSLGQYVNEQAHINGMESFWAMLKRAYMGTFHRISPAHLQRYIDEFAGQHNQRKMDTEVQMVMLVQQMVGRRLHYRELAVGKGEGRVRMAE